MAYCRSLRLSIISQSDNRQFHETPLIKGIIGKMK